MNDELETPYAWLRLATALALTTIGGAGMYVVVVVMPHIEAEFVLDRGGASLPYTLTTVGWGLGGILMGRFADRFGVIYPCLLGSCAMGAGFIMAGNAGSAQSFAMTHGVMLGFFGCSAFFAPLLADITHWFDRRRGIAVAICASGNYVAGSVWPPVAAYFVGEIGWRSTYVGIGIFSLLTMIPLSLLMYRHAPGHARDIRDRFAGAPPPASLGLELNQLQWLLALAGVACCVAMSMPQVHIVSLCHDAGIAMRHGAQMLSLMLACGVISRLAFGVLMDRWGGLRTMLVASSLQCLALLFYLPANGIVSLYTASALFGLFQGGIVPCYAIIVREYFPAGEVGRRVGIVVMATLFGMALGGWMSGEIYDLTGSYQSAFLNGIAWNLLNIAIVVFLLQRRRMFGASTPVAA